MNDKRIGYVTQLFKEAGFSGAEADARGWLTAVYLMGEAGIVHQPREKKRMKLLRQQFELMVSGLPD